MKKSIYFFIFLFFLLIVASFFIFSNSYSKSFQARVLYTIGDYNKAYNLARDVYLKDSYNRMALTVMNQSKIALKYQKYIKDGKKYLKIIEKISGDKKISDQDLAKIKIICEVMMGEYKKLQPILLSVSSLSDNALEINKKFNKIYEELFK